MLGIYEKFQNDKGYKSECPAVILDTRPKNSHLSKLKTAFKADYVNIVNNLNEVCISSAKVLEEEKYKQAQVKKPKIIRKRDAAKASLCLTIFTIILAIMFIVPAAAILSSGTDYSNTFIGCFLLFGGVMAIFVGILACVKVCRTAKKTKKTHCLCC